MTEVWTQDRILALAPDSASAQAGQGLAGARKWQRLGASDRALWGECQGSGKNPYQTRVDLSEPAFKCSCPSRKFPCKHGLGLLLLFAREPGLFAATDPPEWVSAWLVSRDERAERHAAKVEKPEARPANPEAQAVRAAKREAAIAEGLEELDIWLRDLVGQGLAAARARPGSYWETMAARLVDTQAPGLARLVRELPEAAAAGDGWQVRVLERISRIHMIANAHRRADALDEDVRAEVRAAVGWAVPKEAVLASEGVFDQWLVVGRRVSSEDRLRVQRTWLWGARADRPALVLDFAAGAAVLDASLVVGTAFEGELAFYPGASAVRALVKSRGQASVIPESLPGDRLISAALGRFAALLAKCPWSERSLLALRGVVPVTRGSSLLLADREGHALPVTPRFEKGWHLAALSGGRGLDVFGEWDGEWLLPLGVGSGGVFHDVGPRRLE